MPRRYATVFDSSGIPWLIGDLRRLAEGSVSQASLSVNSSHEQKIASTFVTGRFLMMTTMTTHQIAMHSPLPCTHLCLRRQLFLCRQEHNWTRVAD